MHTPTLFQSFFLGGFECSTHRRDDGRRLDLIEATGHGRAAAQDYRAMLRHGIGSVRDGVRWHLIETSPGRYDWSSLLPMVHAAREAGVQVVWDLCHYGHPDDIDIWRPQFVDRFARFAAAVTRLLREETDDVPVFCPVNEIAYWSWAGGDRGMMNPCATGRGFELKHQLVRAAIAGIGAVRAVDPRARFVHVDPVINVAAHPDRPDDATEAAAYTRAQYQGWDMTAGELWPGLGGRPELLDVIGVNYYSDNQWFLGGGTIGREDPRYRPFRDILADVWQRFRRPILVAETGAEGDARSPWLDYVAGEVLAAMEAGIPVEGICLYPILDYPGWTNDRHCPVGLLGFPETGGRPVHRPLADTLDRWQRLFDRRLDREFGQRAARVA
ncbi:beta-glucosidase [Azospirillum thermophilum]|uniref:Beta-glucosidase n=1 Tax=Azospirillum thermophilum TaxID=2202148 RepID=A0A2S2CW94_9PROT|nr:beta-glucosidase [Azospirillum thermophilum]AWK88751.1 beta-glucosidase [Azospirillum thermophilum]